MVDLTNIRTTEETLLALALCTLSVDENILEISHPTASGQAPHPQRGFKERGGIFARVLTNTQRQRLSSP